MRHAGLAAMFQLGEAVFQDLVVLLEHLLGHAELGGAPLHGVVGDQVRHHVDALLRHQLGGRRVDQIAVLDGAHAAFDGAR